MESYIRFAQNASVELNAFLKEKQYNTIAVLVDENTKEHCWPKVSEALPSAVLIQIRSGEQHKHIDTCTQIWQQMTAHSFDRKSLLINLGGGVIGDMGGFAAATYKRGIDFVHVPTTLLAQVDASVGGKLGIDFQGYKNHIGLFQNPKLVIISDEFLASLPERELKSGYAEVLKHGLIADSKNWEARNWETDMHNWLPIIEHSVALKARVVEADPKEKGLRKILNFGHTIGHAVESYLLNKKGREVLHGEAIALGMLTEAYLSVKLLGMAENDLNEIEQKLSEIYKPILLQESELQTIAELAVQDKKNEHGVIKAVLLEEIGKAKYDVVISKENIVDALGYYRKKQS